MLIGYARVSSTDQETTLQRDALRRANVRRVFEEKRSAVKHRPALLDAIAALRPGSTLIVYKVDRLARSLSDLLSIIAAIDARGAMFRSLTEPIDTSSPAGRMTLQLLGAFAEFERAMIRERSMAGQAAAKARGVTFGRPSLLSPEQQADVYARICAGESQSAIARSFGMHPSTICKLHKKLKAGRVPTAPGRHRCATEPKVSALRV